MKVTRAVTRRRQTSKVSLKRHTSGRRDQRADLGERGTKTIISTQVLLNKRERKNKGLERKLSCIDKLVKENFSGEAIT